MKVRFEILMLFCLLLCNIEVNAQQIRIDKGIYTEGLWCFPLHSDSLTYVYLPSRAHLASDEKGDPKFSYLRYVINKPGEGNTNRSITDADGGGILHFLVLYDTPEESILAAENSLKRITKSRDVKLKGPILFEKGSYALVSSILNPDNGKEERKLIAMGDAPIFENSTIALSFSLTPVMSKLLLESFKMKTPDVSLVFDLTFSGLTDAYDAELEINWSEVKKSNTYKAGGTVYFVSADVEAVFEDLQRNNAIKLTSNGSHETMEGLLNTVYDKLLSLLYAPARPDDSGSSDGLGSAMDAILNSNGALGARKQTGFGLNFGYKTKEINSTGVSHLYFKGRSTVSRHQYITFNIGNVYGKYGSDPNYFKDVPLYDITFQQREIFIGVDGELENEFKKMLNSVSIFLNKKHESGNTTVENVIITKETFKKFEKPLSVVYGFDADTNRVAWLDYAYKSIWQFQGGYNYEIPWDSTSASMINLYTPFRRRNILLDGNMDNLKSAGVKMISVLVSYDFFGKMKEQRLTLRPGDNLSEKLFEITLPNNQEDVAYELTWVKTDGSVISKKGIDKYGLIFIDEMP